MNTFIGQRVRSTSFFPIPHPPFPFPRSNSSYQCFSITLSGIFIHIYLYLCRKDTQLSFQFFSTSSSNILVLLYISVPSCDFCFFLQQKLALGGLCIYFVYQQWGQSVFGDTLHCLGQSKKSKRILLPAIKAEGGRACSRLNQQDDSTQDLES